MERVSGGLVSFLVHWVIVVRPQLHEKDVRGEIERGERTDES